MSVQVFCQRLGDAKYSDKDKKWFPRWIRRFAATQNGNATHLTITSHNVIEFSRSLMKKGIPAWQRLQAVRAIEAYRNLVIESDQPSLSTIRRTLARIASSERAFHSTCDNERKNKIAKQVFGIIDRNEPIIIQNLRRELRVQYKERDTEKAYVGWVQRFIKYCGSTELERFAEPEIRGFLTQLAAEHHVAPSTQKQAKCALLFLYQQVLARELAFLDVVAAKKSPRLPVVLSRQEIGKLMTEFSGTRRLMFELLYGAGLRHRGCRRLRIKDICFDESHIVVRNAKGNEDRITVLPDCCRQSLVEQAADGRTKSATGFDDQGRARRWRGG